MIIADLKNFFYDNRYLWPILLLGLLARLYAFSHTYVINPDGVYYLYQAKALLYNMPDKVGSCGYPFISLYPVLIMLFYKIFGDWIVAAKAVSLLFGVMTIVPFYFLMKRFFTITVASITTLIFSLNPVLVERSVDLIKGPIFWFFSVLGLLLFVKALDRHKGRLFLFSSITFFIAGLARIDAMFLFFGSLLYLIFRSGRTAKSIISFSIPLLVIFCAIGASFFISENGLPIWNLYIEPRVMPLITNTLFNPVYNVITTNLETLHTQQFEQFPAYFFKDVKHLLWLVALGLFFKSCMNAFYLPFYILFFSGFFSIKKALKKAPLSGYFFFQTVLASTFVYLFLVSTWFIERRYIAVVMFPAFFFIGLGVEKLIESLKSRRIKEGLIIPGLYILTILITLPENLESVGKDMLAIKEIGDKISLEAEGRSVRIATSEKRIITYANISIHELICPNPVIEYNGLTQMPYPDLIALLKEKDIEYFIWEESEWEKSSYDLLKEVKAGDMIIEGRWEYNETALILFRVIGI